MEYFTQEYLNFDIPVGLPLIKNYMMTLYKSFKL